MRYLVSLMTGIDLGLIWVASRITRFAVMFSIVWIVGFVSGKVGDDGKGSVMDATLSTVTLGDFAYVIVWMVVIFSLVFSPDVAETGRRKR